MGKRFARWARRDISEIAADITAPDASVRADAVGDLCPCHAGWEVFEKNVSAVLRHLRDGNRVVKAHALHVYDDASRMESLDDLSYWLEPGEERIGEKRALGHRSMEQRLEARRENKIRRLKKRRRVPHRGSAPNSRVQITNDK